MRNRLERQALRLLVIYMKTSNASQNRIKGLEYLNTIINGHYAFQMLSTAVEVGLFELLESYPGMTIDEIAARLKIHLQPARILVLGCLSLWIGHQEGRGNFQY